MQKKVHKIHGNSLPFFLYVSFGIMCTSKCYVMKDLFITNLNIICSSLYKLTAILKIKGVLIKRWKKAKKILNCYYTND